MMLTVRNGEEDKVGALGAGVHDFVTKPFSVRELVSIKASIRSWEMPPMPDATIMIGDLSVCATRRLLMKRGKQFRLTKKEFEIVYLLMRHRGRPVSHKRILSAVWALNTATMSNT